MFLNVFKRNAIKCLTIVRILIKSKEKSYLRILNGIFYIKFKNKLIFYLQCLEHILCNKCNILLRIELNKLQIFINLTLY